MMDANELGFLVADRRYEAVRDALSRDPSLIHARPDEADLTPLHEAAKFLDLRMVQELLKWEPDVNAKGIGGQTPLHYAVKSGDEENNEVFEVVQTLLQHGADPTIPDDKGMTAARLARAMNPRMPSTAALLRDYQPAAPGAGEREVEIDELLLLVENGQVDEVREALRAKPALIHARSDDLDTPLHIAAWQGKAAMVEELLKWGPEVNAKGDSGRTPLHYAVEEDADEGTDDVLTVVEMLLRHGADPTIKDKVGMTPLQIAEVVAMMLPRTVALMREYSGRGKP